MFFYNKFLLLPQVTWGLVFCLLSIATSFYLLVFFSSNVRLLFYPSSYQVVQIVFASTSRSSSFGWWLSVCLSVTAWLGNYLNPIGFGHTFRSASETMGLRRETNLLGNNIMRKKTELVLMVDNKFIATHKKGKDWSKLGKFEIGTRKRENDGLISGFQRIGVK